MRSHLPPDNERERLEGAAVLIRPVLEVEDSILKVEKSSIVAWSPCAWQHLPLEKLSDFNQYGRFQSHVSWDVMHDRSITVRPILMDRRIGSLRLRRILTGPCRGSRGPAEIERDDDAYFCLSFVTRGSEVVRNGGQHVRCDAGDIWTWHSSQSVSFEVPELREKLAIYIPQTSMEEVLSGPATYTGLCLKRGSSIGSLLSGFLGRLCDDDLAIADSQMEAEIANITLDLIGSSIAAYRRASTTAVCTPLFERAISFILRNLDNSELNPAMVANAAAVSLRHLHVLFAEQGHTVMGWVRNRRLAQCRAELERAGKNNITQIALRWGFTDAAHFSRTFKSYYGLSPRSVRTMGADSRPLSRNSTLN